MNRSVKGLGHRKERYVLLGKLHPQAGGLAMEGAKPEWPVWAFWIMLAIGAALAVLWAQGPNLCGIQRAVLMVVLVLVAREDLRSFRIPNALLVGGLVLRAVFLIAQTVQDVQAMQPSFEASGIFAAYAKGAAARGAHLGLESMFNAVVFSGVPLAIALILERLLGKSVLGGGDVKLLFVVGCFFSFGENMLGTLLACTAGTVVAVAQRLRRPFSENCIAFGAAIALGYFAMMMLY